MMFPCDLLLDDDVSVSTICCLSFARDSSYVMVTELFGLCCRGMIKVSFRLALHLRREVNHDAVSLIHFVEGMFQHCGTLSIAWSLVYGTYSGHGSNDSLTIEGQVWCQQPREFQPPIALYCKLLQLKSSVLDFGLGRDPVPLRVAPDLLVPSVGDALLALIGWVVPPALTKLGLEDDQIPLAQHKHAVQGSADVAYRTPLAPYEKSKFLGSGGSMVARLKLKGIDGRAPPGVEPAA
ncbi:hypothetical protein Tco_0259848 [Tanacetum coccineum]